MEKVNESPPFYGRRAGLQEAERSFQTIEEVSKWSGIERNTLHKSLSTYGLCYRQLGCVVVGEDSAIVKDAYDKLLLAEDMERSAKQKRASIYVRVPKQQGRPASLLSYQLGYGAEVCQGTYAEVAKLFKMKIASLRVYISTNNGSYVYAKNQGHEKTYQAAARSPSGLREAWYAYAEGKGQPPDEFFPQQTSHSHNGKVRTY